MAPNMDYFTEIESLELELVDKDTRGNRIRLSELIAEDFEEFGTSGKVYRKKDILDSLPNKVNIKYNLSSFRFKELGTDCVLVTYTSIVNEITTLRSSIWKMHNGKWQISHHQSTIVPSSI